MNTKTKNTPAPNQLAFGLTTPVLAATPKDADPSDRPTRQDRLDAARAVLARGLSGVRDDPAVLKAYLSFRGRFLSYSARNTLLIWMQRPTARYTMGFRSWAKHGRRVRKGERGLVVLAPILRRPTEGEVTSGQDPETRVPVGFKTATTFDYEQTEAVTDDALVYVPPVPRLDADGPDGLLAKLEAAAAQIGCSVHYSSIGYADGWYREFERAISVRASLSGADLCSVLTHELAHALAHAQGAPGAEAVLSAPSRASKELQAEGAAYVALAALGLDTARASLPYLKGWAGGDDDALAAELDAVDRIAGRLLALVDGAAKAVASTTAN